MSRTPYLDDLVATARKIRADSVAYEYAYNMAVGVFGDDLDNPTVVCTIYQGKLLSLSVHDQYVKAVESGIMGWGDVSIAVSAAVMNAYVQWESELERLTDAARAYLDAHPEQAVAVNAAVDNPDDAPAELVQAIDRS